MNDIPANQMAMAYTLAAVSGRQTTPAKRLANAKAIMDELRTRGFRLVPFPPLNTMEKVRARVARAKQATKGKRAKKKNGK